MAEAASTRESQMPSDSGRTVALSGTVKTLPVPDTVIWPGTPEIPSHQADVPFVPEAPAFVCCNAALTPGSMNSPKRHTRVVQIHGYKASILIITQAHRQSAKWDLPVVIRLWGTWRKLHVLGPRQGGNGAICPIRFGYEI